MVVLALVVVATTARAEQNLGSAGYMLPLCKGISESFRAFELSCPPNGVNNEQLMRMVVQYVEVSRGVARGFRRAGGRGDDGDVALPQVTRT
jgi:hypothetical protein